jgi:hypothetical protein
MNKVRPIELHNTYRRFAVCCAIIAALLVGFVLSCGPAQLLSEHGAFNPPTIAGLDVVYRPLARVSESASAAGWALRAYMRLWTKGTYFDEARFKECEERHPK